MKPKHIVRGARELLKVFAQQSKSFYIGFALGIILTAIYLIILLDMLL